MVYKKEWDLKPLLHKNTLNYEKIETSIKALEVKTAQLSIKSIDFSLWAEIRGELEEAFSLIICLTSQDITDEKAAKLEASLNALVAKLEYFEVEVSQEFKSLSDDKFQNILEKKDSHKIAFFLNELREHGKKKLSSEKENLILELAVPGHHAISSMYYTYMSSLEFKYQDQKLGLSKLEPYFSSHERKERLESHKALEAELTKSEAMFGSILNSIAGFRLKVYEKRGWGILDETLEKNRMSQKSLTAMLDAIKGAKGPILEFMRAKAKLFGLKKLSYCDLGAPLLSVAQSIDYDKGCEIILNTFKKKTPIFATFSKKALKNGWVDALKREKKRAGGFCTSCPIVKESRILLTWGNNVSSLSTLAHELGHAFHNEVLFKQPVFYRDISMNIAEAASTMAEMIVCDSLIESAKTKQEKISLLDDKISRYISFMMDIHARFIFEKNLYEKRKENYLTPNELTNLMIDAQKESFCDELEEVLPHFWAYKMHFFFSETPFYNWPYAFGYLFSLGVYNELNEDPKFEDKYIDLLKDSGSMQMEELAKKHLNVDISEQYFWQKACQVLEKDIQTFLAMV